MDLKKEEDASEEGRRVDKAREEEDGHYNEQKEDKALEEDRHDNELPAAKVLGEDRREPPLPALPEGNPQTFEEHLAMLADLTTYFHALNGTRPRVRPTGTPELGDLVEMAQGSDHLQGYAVVTEVHEAHLTVMVLYEDRRTVRAESWPYKSNVMLESVVGRLGKRVQVKPSCNAQYAGREGQVALDERHSEFPIFIQRGQTVELVVNVRFSASESAHFGIDELCEVAEG